MDLNLLLLLVIIWSLGLIMVIKNPFNFRLFLLAKAFSVQLCFISLVFFIILLIFQQIVAAIVALMPIIIFLLLLLESRVKFLKTNIKADNKNRLACLQINSSHKNNKIEKFAKEILKIDPDFISIIEYHYPNDSRYKSLLTPKYKYNIIEPPQHPYGIGLYSKYPIEKESLVVIRNQMILVVKMQINNQPLRIIAAHPYPPVTKRQKETHDQIFKEIQNFLKAKFKPTIVIGDFNAVPWYPQIINLVTDNNLRYSSTIWQTTFPAWLPLIRIPIDHILFSDDIKSDNCRRVRLPGSDHLGLSVNLHLPQ